MTEGRASWAHTALLATIEWLVSLLLGRILASAIAAPLTSHPRGGDALLDDGGRIAIELLSTRLGELQSSGASIALIVALYVLVTVPLQGALPAIATAAAPNPWARSIERTPTLVALALAHAVLLALLAWSARSFALVQWTRAVSPSPAHAMTSLYIALALAAIVIVALRAFFALARCAAVLSYDARASLACALDALRARPASVVLTRGALELSSLALAAIAAAAPRPLPLLASLGAHLARVAIERKWLAWGSKSIVRTASKHDNY